jgi:hypothetical protein
MAKMTCPRCDETVDAKRLNWNNITDQRYSGTWDSDELQMDRTRSRTIRRSGPHGNSSPGTPSETQTSSPTVVTSRGAPGNSIRATT